MEISTFFISKLSSLHSGQFRDKKSLDLHEKSLDLSNYEIFPRKVLKSRTFKKSSILIVISSSPAWKLCCIPAGHKLFLQPRGLGFSLQQGAQKLLGGAGNLQPFLMHKNQQLYNC
jgi:hypothetical protein